MSSEAKLYPGDEATPEQMFLLASEYRRAAETLRPNGRRKEPLSFWPYRLVAIQAIELYLNAFLLVNGEAARAIRRMHHNFGARADLADERGLGLRKLTREHLHTLTETKEYWAARYWPEPFERASQINRMDATLAEIASKVEAVLSRKKQ